MTLDEKIDEVLTDYDLLRHQDCDDSCGNKGTEQEAIQSIRQLITDEVLGVLGELEESSQVVNEWGKSIDQIFVPLSAITKIEERLKR